MRVLFSCTAGEGHFVPLLPLARAFRDRGDEVAFATGADFAPRIEAEGLTAFAAGLEQDVLDARFAEARARIFTLPIPERRALQFTHRFALTDAPARVEELRSLAEAWRPDVLVHESAELAAPIVGTSLGLPTVHQSFGRMVPPATIERAAAAVAPLWSAAGLEPDPHAGLFRGLYVDIAPPGLRSDRPPAGTVVLPLRPYDAGHDRTTEGRPLVYLTLGTVVRGVPVLRLLLAALAPLDVDVLVTTGRQNDPTELGAVPPNVTVERFVPQEEVLARASLVVTHGGSGTLLGALAHGRALLVVPQAADQFDNAAAAAQTGAACVLLPDELTEERAREAARALLTQPSYRSAARALAREIAAMPSPSDVAERIAALG